MKRDHDGGDSAVRRALATHIGVPLSDLEWDHRLTGDLGLDRFDVLELVDALEEEFSVAIPDDAVSHLETVSDLASCLRARPLAA